MYFWMRYVTLLLEDRERSMRVCGTTRQLWCSAPEPEVRNKQRQRNLYGFSFAMQLNEYLNLCNKNEQ